MIFYNSQFETMIPVIFLGLMGFVFLASGKIKRSGDATIYSLFSIGVFTITALLILLYDTGLSTYFYENAFLINNFGAFFAIISLASSAYISYSAGRKIDHNPEIFFSVLLFVNVAIIIAAFSVNLIFIFISFEGISIGTYILAAFGRTKRNLEASAKYFFTGIIATGFIVLGSSYYYLSTGTFNLVPLSVNNHSMLIALILLFVGLGFKLAIVPMHQWAVDAYDGTENSVSAFLASGTKTLAYLLLLRVFLIGFESIKGDVFILFTIISIITMTYGNFAALSENNFKRMLAYSSIAQAGYLILVISAVSYSSSSFVFTIALFSAMYYSLVYIFMKGGSFLAADAVKKEKVMIEDLSGIGKRSPSFAISLSVLMLSLAGIPPVAGFFAKYYLFLSLISANLWYLAVIGILNSAISVFYYLRVIVIMFRSNVTTDEKIPNSVVIPVVISAILMFIFSLVIFYEPTIAGFTTGFGGI